MVSIIVLDFAARFYIARDKVRFFFSVVNLADLLVVATLIIPLDRTANLAVQVRAQAFNFAGAAPQAMDVFVNDRQVASGLAVPAEWTTIEFETPADAWRTGVNRLRLSFARTHRPADVGLGGDPRPLAAAVDYVRVQVR